MFERGETSKNVLYTAGTPVHMRKSERQGADMEWEYGFCIAFFFRDRIVDVQWKESPDEPQPIYRWSGKVILK